MNIENLPQRGITGEYTTDGMPHGSTSLTPFFALAGAAGAVEFYRSVFGARIVDTTEINGVVVHAELDFGNGRLQLGEPSPDYGLIPPPDGEQDCFSIGLYCGDVDVVVERAVSAGAVIREPVTTFISGDRFASLRDPFGVRWAIMTRVEDLSEDESSRRVAAWAADQEAANAP